MSTKSTEKQDRKRLFTGDGIGARTFNFFASLQLAIATLSCLIIVLAIGTIVESRYNADAARILVYDTPWLTLILVLLVINLACSAADRLPWQKKHVGFVLTHLGIILILAGSLATQEAAVDGQMSMVEGESAKWVTLKEPMLYAFTQAFEEERMIPFKERALRWKGREKIASFSLKDKKADIYLKQFYPNAKVEEVWTSASYGVAALKVSLKNSFVDVSHWLADKPENNELPLGPAVLKLTKEFASPEDKNKTPMLKLSMYDESWDIPITESQTAPFEHKISENFSVNVLALYDYAYVEENVLKEGVEGKHPENPAAELEISKDGKTEKHTVFVHFPDFPTVHGKPDSELGFQAQYIDPRITQATADNELRFVEQPDGLYYQVVSGEKISQGKVQVGKETETGWMDLKFTVESYFPQATKDIKVIPLDDDDPSESAVAAISLEINSSTETKSFWLTEGLQKSMMVEGGVFELVYGRRQLGLGFEVKLKDFRIKFDPGTERAAAYESDVVVNDFTEGNTFEQTISMNQPLALHGFHVYQAGYQQEEDGTEASVFAVAYDPGIPVKYAGALIMVFGILLMFYTRAYSSTNEKGIK